MKTVGIVFDVFEDAAGFEHILQSGYLKDGEYCASYAVEDRGGNLNYRMDITVEDSSILAILSAIEGDTGADVFDIQGEAYGIEFGSDACQGILNRYSGHKEERRLHW